MKNKIIIGGVIIILIVLGLTYKKPSDKVMKVGVITPLTGQYGSIGESIKNSMELAIGTSTNVQLIFEDSKFEAKLGLSAFQKLTSIDNIDFLVVVDSPTLDAITPIVAKTKLPVIQIFEAKDHQNDTIFQMLPFSYDLFSDLGKLSEEHYKRIALAYGGATDVLAIDADYFKKGITSSSTIVNETVTTGNTDFRSEVTKILATNPDAVTNIFALEDGIKFIKQLNAQKGTKKVAIICDANIEFAINDYIKALGEKTFEGCLSTNLPNMMSEQFKTEYKSKFNAEPTIASDWAYDAVTIIKSLATQPKNTWLNSLQKTSFDGVSGHVQFDENGTRLAVSERHVFKDSKFVKFGE